MEKKEFTYQSVSDEQLMANEPSVAYPNSISQVDALWTLIANQAESVQRILEERLHNLLLQKDRQIGSSYTMEELHNRIMISEQQFANGEIKSQDEVNKDVEALFESWN